MKTIFYGKMSLFAITPMAVYPSVTRGELTILFCKK